MKRDISLTISHYRSQRASQRSRSGPGETGLYARPKANGTSVFKISNSGSGTPVTRDPVDPVDPDLPDVLDVYSAVSVQVYWPNLANYGLV